MGNSRSELLKIERDLKAIANKREFDLLSSYTPYPKQAEFHDLGCAKTERALQAGNRTGKSFCGAAEMAFHLTGRYPDWWYGRRWDRPVKGWAASETGLMVRDVAQSKLCGQHSVVEKRGTGMIPKDAVKWDKDVTLARGVSGLYDTVLVEHRTNGKVDGKSILTFKTYDQGREKWQGDGLDVVWCDEEPPLDIYSEAVTRLAPMHRGDTRGMIYLTYTPLSGTKKVVPLFRPPLLTEDRALVNMTIDDALHIDPEEKKKQIASWQDWEREARALGVPIVGTGRVFSYLESAIKCDPFIVPKHWYFIWGLDFGTRHPFAAVLLAWDKDNDVIYVVKCVRMANTLPLNHVAAMKAAMNGCGNTIPAAWPQDGHQREEFDGKLEPLSKIYKMRGQKMLDHHATFQDGSNSTEAGIMEMQDRFSTARLKVFSDCVDWFDEYRFYSRDDGELVKENDDLMSATRVGVMARRFAKPVLWLPAQPGGGQTAMAKDVDIDPFG